MLEDSPRRKATVACSAVPGAQSKRKDRAARGASSVDRRPALSPEARMAHSAGRSDHETSGGMGESPTRSSSPHRPDFLATREGFEAGEPSTWAARLVRAKDRRRTNSLGDDKESDGGT